MIFNTNSCIKDWLLFNTVIYPIYYNNIVFLDRNVIPSSQNWPA